MQRRNLGVAAEVEHRAAGFEFPFANADVDADTDADFVRARFLEGSGVSV
jgi:hypothetical protein